MNIKILMITYNRPEYLKLSLPRLFESVSVNGSIVIWDNGSLGETLEVLNKYEKYSQIERIVYNNSNAKLWEPTNWFWQNYRDSDFLSKVDDDCLVPLHWCEILEQAFKDIPKAGILGCWRFLPEDFNKGVAEKKIQNFGNHRILRNCWVEGSGYLMKRDVINEIGYLRKNESFTDYCIRAAARGFINGWYYPFLYQEHMDDPRTENTGIKSDDDFQRLIPLSAKIFNIKTRDEWLQRLKMSAKRLQEYSIDPDDFLGIKPKIKHKILKALGREYFPRFNAKNKE
jgi:glycosyltransferase involved in cell wall biosynthesis